MVNNPEATELDVSAGGQEITPSARIIRKIFAWSGENLHLIGVGILLLLIIAVFISGFFRVDLDERATKRRFGELIDARVEPGLHWKMPLGVDKIDKFPTQRVFTTEVVAQMHPAIPVFTGDFNLVNAAFRVQYKVSNLREFLFQHEHPLETMEMKVRSAFTNVVSNMFVYMVLATEKTYIEKAVADVLSQSLRQLDLGINLLSVNLVYVSPPANVVAAFRAVNDAKAQRIEVIEAAKRRRMQTLAQARGVAAEIVETAQADAEAHIKQAQSQAAIFRAKLSSKNKNPVQTTHTQYWNSVRKIMSEARIVVLRPGEAPNIEVNLMEAPSPISSYAATEGKGEHDKKGIRAADKPSHPGSTAAHVVEETSDRKPGIGEHSSGNEVHHFGPVPDNSRKLPSHKLDPNVKNPQPALPSHLGLPHNKSESKSDDKSSKNKEQGSHSQEEEKDVSRAGVDSDRNLAQPIYKPSAQDKETLGSAHQPGTFGDPNQDEGYYTSRIQNEQILQQQKIDSQKQNLGIPQPKQIIKSEIQQPTL